MKKYFCTANTCEGLVNYTEYNLENIEKIYSVKATPKASVDLLVRKTGEFFERLELETEYIVSPIDMGMYCGVFIRKAGIGVLDCDLYSDGNLVVLDEYHRDGEDDGKISEFLKMVYGEYKKAKKIHDEWEKIYIDNMDFKRLDEYGKNVIDLAFEDSKSDKNPVCYKRFFGASAPGGAVNYINMLTDGLEKRFFIKGRPGTGKSTFLKKVAKEAEQRGFDTEIYCCSFDPKSLDMVIVRELGLCVFDSTAPHELFPMKNSDYILDFYVEAGLSGIDEKYKNQLLDISRSYREVMQNGVEYLKNASKLYVVRERILSSFVDYKRIDKVSKIICVD